MDIRCVVCGEPWNLHGIRPDGKGDMLAWEAILFRAGAGCPGCEGRAPEGGAFEPESLSDVENGDGDPIERIDAWERYRDGQAPRWERPAPEILWSCRACGVNVVRDPDDLELVYDLPLGATGAKWYHSHPYDRGEPDEKPAHVFGQDSDGDIGVCEFCLDSCESCGAHVSSTLTSECGLDCYAEGYCGTPEGYGPRDVYCIECIGSTCGSCGGIRNDHQDDCSCFDECRRQVEKWEFDTGQDLAPEVIDTIAASLTELIQDRCDDTYRITDTVFDVALARSNVMLDPWPEDTTP